VVATVRALKYHGGREVAELENEDVEAMLGGMSNLEHHLDVLREVFDLPVVVALNRFPSDTDAELEAAIAHLTARGVRAEVAEHWAQGGQGALDLAEAVIAEAAVDEVVVDQVEGGDADAPVAGPFAYALEDPPEQKLEAVARRVHGAAGVELSPSARRDLRRLSREGYGNLPVCIAKTQYSLSTDPKLRGAPRGHVLPVREVRLAAGAGFIVAVCGSIMTMPGLPARPAAETFDVDGSEAIVGLS
jgi:formate--tetrahydrofolate ligase